MQTYPKKRIEIVIEAPLMRRLAERFEAAGVAGYTVLPVLAGSGRGGPWSAEGSIGEAGMVCVICIVDAARVDPVLDAVYGLVARQIGLVSIADCQVIRAERF